MRLRLASERSKRLLLLLLVALAVIAAGMVLHGPRTSITLSGLEGGIGRILRGIILFLLGFLVQTLPSGLISALPVLVALAFIPWLASRFIAALYDTKDLKEAHKFLQRNVFGMNKLKPLLIVKEGKLDVGAGSLTDLVGGRGVLIVYNDSAAVLEKGGQLTRVVGPSLCFLNRFERVWDVIDLRCQRWPITVNAMTKEGIPISCEADIAFRIDDRADDKSRHQSSKTSTDAGDSRTPADPDPEIAKALDSSGISEPLPFTEEAVFKAATSTWIRIRQEEHLEQLRHWTGRVVIGEVEGTLRSILADFRLDWLIQPYPPEGPHPRKEIRDQLKKKVEAKFPPGNKLGAQILDINLGRISIEHDKITQQWIEAWQSEWEQRVVESYAEGEAELARVEAVRIQAQADIALALAEAVRPIVTTGDELSSYKLATRFVETLWWIAYSPGTRSSLPPEVANMLSSLQRRIANESEEV